LTLRAGEWVMIDVVQSACRKGLNNDLSLFPQLLTGLAGLKLACYHVLIYDPGFKPSGPTSVWSLTTLTSPPAANPQQSTMAQKWL
jgi:hypothetical protein